MTEPAISVDDFARNYATHSLDLVKELSSGNVDTKLRDLLLRALQLQFVTAIRVSEMEKQIAKEGAR